MLANSVRSDGKFAFPDPVGVQTMKTTQTPGSVAPGVLFCIYHPKGYRLPAGVATTFPGKLKDFQGYETGILAGYTSSAGQKVGMKIEGEHYDSLMDKWQFWEPDPATNQGGLLRFASHDQQAEWIAQALQPLGRMIEYCWSTHPHFLTAAVRKVLASAVSVVVPGAAQPGAVPQGGHVPAAYQPTSPVVAGKGGDFEDFERTGDGDTSAAADQFDAANNAFTAFDGQPAAEVADTDSEARRLFGDQAVADPNAEFTSEVVEDFDSQSQFGFGDADAGIDAFAEGGEEVVEEVVEYVEGEAIEGVEGVDYIIEEVEVEEGAEGETDFGADFAEPVAAPPPPPRATPVRAPAPKPVPAAPKPAPPPQARPAASPQQSPAAAAPPPAQPKKAAAPKPTAPAPAAPAPVKKAATNAAARPSPVPQTVRPPAPPPPAAPAAPPAAAPKKVVKKVVKKATQ